MSSTLGARRARARRAAPGRRRRPEAAGRSRRRRRAGSRRRAGARPRARRSPLLPPRGSPRAAPSRCRDAAPSPSSTTRTPHADAARLASCDALTRPVPRRPRAGRRARGARRSARRRPGAPSSSSAPPWLATTFCAVARPTPRPALLGREERVEDALAQLRLDAGSVVGDRDHEHVRHGCVCSFASGRSAASRGDRPGARRAALDRARGLRHEPQPVARAAGHRLERVHARDSTSTARSCSRVDDEAAAAPPRSRARSRPAKGSARARYAERFLEQRDRVGGRAHRRERAARTRGSR